MANITLGESGHKKVAKKFKKACRTRWLSLDQSVQSAYDNYLALLLTFKELKRDPLSLGPLKRFETPKFLYTVYILQEVLPILSNLSKIFQTSSINFSHISPAIERTKAQLVNIMESKQIIDHLNQDLGENGRLHQIEINFSETEQFKAIGILNRYIDALLKNIDYRFKDSLPVISAFSVFDPMIMPAKDSPEFLKYAHTELSTLAEHFFGTGEDARSDSAKQLFCEWDAFKYNMVTGVKMF